MTRRPPPPSLIRREVSAPPPPRPEPPKPPPVRSQTQTAALCDIVLAVPSLELARRIQAEAQAWAISPLKGKGLIGIRVIVDPDLPTYPDATRILTQIVENGITTADNLIDSKIMWGEPKADDQG